MDFKRALNRANFTPLAIVSLFLVVPPAASAGTAETFRSEAPQAWKKLKAGILQGFEVEQHTKEGSPTNGRAAVDADEGAQYKHALRASGSNELVRTTYLKGGPGGARVEAVNDRYAFNLTNAGEGTSWMVTNVDQNPDNAKTKQYGVLLGNSIVFYGIMVEGDWLENLVNSPGFEIVSAEETGPDRSNRAVKIAFSSHHAVDGANTVLGGTMSFLPDKYWVLDRYDVEIQSKTKGRGRAEFQYQDLEGYPFLKERVQDYEFEGDKPIRYHDEFGPVTRCAAEPSAFRLTAFGIPEPGVVGSRRHGWWVVTCLIGVVLFCSALALHRYSTRRGGGERSV